MKWWKEIEIEEIKKSEWFPSNIGLDMQNESIFKFMKIIYNYVEMDKILSDENNKH